MDKDLFNLWSTTYNIDIEASNNTFPFGGYDIVKAVIDDLAIEKHNTTVLDLGIGTGIISSILYDKGANIYGVDFSEEMLNQCKTAMNDAVLINCDLSKGLADLELPKFSYVLSTYVFHHFDDTVKMNLIKDALAHLNETGTFILSDICFPNCCDLEQFKSSNLDRWDEDESYIIADEFVDLLNRNDLKFHYRQFNVYTGLFSFTAV